MPPSLSLARSSRFTNSSPLSSLVRHHHRFSSLSIPPASTPALHGALSASCAASTTSASSKVRSAASMYSASTAMSQPPLAPVAIPGLTLVQGGQAAAGVVHQLNNKQGSSKHASSSSSYKRRNLKDLPRDPVRPPSPSSGGIPEPMPQYMTRAMLEPKRLPQPRQILIVMDLNGTLLHRPNKRRPFHFVERPHARTFLNYCLDTFYVAIWSSARPENVSKMVAQLLTEEQRERCLVMWGRDQFGLSAKDYDARVQVYKRLTSVWSTPRVLSAHPDAQRGGVWDQSNTVLVDDSLEKARSEPFNLLQLPEFAGLESESPNVLPQVHDYLNSLASQADVSRYIRLNPFKLNDDYVLLPASQ